MVMDSFLTDTADYADIVLPATTQLEHYDVHKSYGHLYVLANNPAIAPVGESLPNSRGVPAARRAHGLRRAVLPRLRRGHLPHGARVDEPRMRGIGGKRAEGDRLAAARVPERFAPFAEGGFPTPSGKCEFYSAALGEAGHRPAAVLQPAGRVGGQRPAAGAALSARLPLAAGAQFPQLLASPTWRASASSRASRTWTCTRRTPRRAASRDGDLVRVFNDRGSYRCARASTASRAAAWWWRRRCGGRSTRPTAATPTTVTSQRTADLGGGATFYDCLVQVERADLQTS